MDEAPSPRERYRADLERPDFQHDPAQAQAVDALERVYQELIGTPPSRLRRRWVPVRGLYLWGDVGRGKTYLMDCFFESLPFTRKHRTHFHRFMQGVHEARKKYKNERDPLRLIARDLGKTRVLCFDEFYVSDVADAMILGQLTTALFAQGVTLIATSNIAPDNLYKDGLQRARFLPAVDRIQRRCQVMHLDNGIDYRWRALEDARLYHHSTNGAAHAQLDHYFQLIAQGSKQKNADLTVRGRTIHTQSLAEDVVWFNFDALCTGARSADDYSELARCFHTVLLEDIPVLTGEQDDSTRRLINLVDEFYDRGVKLIISAEAAPEDLYTGKRLAFEFRRTISRLHEMGSREYLQRAHLP